MQFHRIEAQIAVADVYSPSAHDPAIMHNDHLEIIVGDMGGNLVLVDMDGNVLWDVLTSGSLPFTPVVGKIRDMREL